MVYYLTPRAHKPCAQQQVAISPGILLLCREHISEAVNTILMESDGCY
jgi:hypothetical protein